MPALSPVASIPVAGVPPATNVLGWLSAWDTPVRERLSVAILTASVVSAPFIPSQPSFAWSSQFSQPSANLTKIREIEGQPWLEQEPPPQLYPVFTRFSEPVKAKWSLLDAVEQPWLEQEPPVIVTWGWNSAWPQPGKKSLAYLINWEFHVPEAVPPKDVFIDVYRKKKKRKDPDLIAEELERKRKIRASIEDAIYGKMREFVWRAPDVKYTPAPQTNDLARIVLAAQQANALKQQQEQEQQDEDDLLLLISEE